ncbi:MAG TPA: carboxypeptidase-like regulatory domain-containing protein, partial [Anaeromyxobacteraceae bacterium]|nr:carboxypeptidase-like regulatory domain-containing protein [Anaeromyxobacteraceae bacterium]
ALAPDGAVVQMQSDTAEVRFVRWVLKPVPQGGIAGEGLVRGRVVDPGRSVAGATVLVARLHLSIPVGPDGTFEVRLPAGTWLMSLRRAAAPGLELAASDLRVAVAAGATVDVGAVSLAPRPKPAAPAGPGLPGSPVPAGPAESFPHFPSSFLAPRGDGSDARTTGEPPAR